MAMTDWLDPLPWLVMLPLAWGTLAFALGPGRGGRLAVAAIALQLLLAPLLGSHLLDTGPRQYAVGGWGAPLGIDIASGSGRSAPRGRTKKSPPGTAGKPRRCC